MELEPERAQRRAGVPPARRARQRERFRSVGAAGGGRRDACPTLRFMESEVRDKIAAAVAHIFRRKNPRAGDANGMLHCWREFVAVKFVIVVQSIKFMLVCSV